MAQTQATILSDQALVDALEQQVACYRRLAKLAEAQHEHVQQGRTEELLEVLSLRQAVLDQIGELERTLAPAKAQWGATVRGMGAAERLKAETLLAETRRLLELITAADRNDALVLQQRKLNLKKEIGQAAVGRQVNRTYAAAAYSKPIPRMDVKR